MKVSIITPCFNSASTIEETIESVRQQTYPDIEHIVIDGKSDDGTVDLIKENRQDIDVFISEKDAGIYQAINKGLKKSTGDILGILNSDDVYQAEEVIEKVVSEFRKQTISAVYGDLQYIDGREKKVMRYWEAGEFDPSNFSRGWMPPHPTLFFTREMYEEHGLYKEEFKIAADYELILRFLYKNKIPVSYIPEVLVQMKVGGKSNDGFKSRFVTFLEDYKAWKENDLKKIQGLKAQVLKRATKIEQFFPWITRN